MWMYNHAYDWQIVGIVSIGILLILFTRETTLLWKGCALFVIALIAAPIRPAWHFVSPFILFFERVIYGLGLWMILKTEGIKCTIKS